MCHLPQVGGDGRECYLHGQGEDWLRNICDPDLRKCLCLSGHYTLYLSVISSLLQLTSGISLWPDLAGFVLCVYFFLVIPANKHTQLTLPGVSTEHTQTIILINAPKRSEDSAGIANQHQLCALTAPDVSSKMNCICSAAHKEQCMRGWDQTLEWPLRARAVGLHGKCSTAHLQNQLWASILDLLLCLSWDENENCR